MIQLDRSLLQTLRRRYVFAVESLGSTDLVLVAMDPNNLEDAKFFMREEVWDKDPRIREVLPMLAQTAAQKSMGVRFGFWLVVLGQLDSNGHYCSDGYCIRIGLANSSSN